MYRGLQPTSRRDVIFLSRDMNVSTPVHETVHAQLNLGELGTGAVTNLLLVKYRFLQGHPFLKGLAQRKVNYRRCMGCQEFPAAHSAQFAGRVEHYIKA